MSALARCPSCQIPLRVPDVTIGRLFKCPACDRPFQVRALSVQQVPPEGGLNPLEQCPDPARLSHEDDELARLRKENEHLRREVEKLHKKQAPKKVWVEMNVTEVSEYDLEVYTYSSRELAERSAALTAIASLRYHLLSEYDWDQDASSVWEDLYEEYLEDREENDMEKREEDIDSIPPPLIVCALCLKRGEYESIIDLWGKYNNQYGSKEKLVILPMEIDCEVKSDVQRLQSILEKYGVQKG